ncbi:endonuclease domain-containing protein [Kitasatospora sp. NPDC057518]|uniref:endonuclease domain-containing protein n=1 Tax=Kitasatospora sp. NPDC057518 TaxID=3346155 RepID=UPI003691B9CD
MAISYLMAWQKFRCAICGDRTTLQKDHDHSTGLVRGGLCESCNRGEGHAKTAPVYLDYRRRHPASILGVQIPYEDPWTKKAIRISPKNPDDQCSRLSALKVSAAEFQLSGKPIPDHIAIAALELAEELINPQ